MFHATERPLPPSPLLFSLLPDAQRSKERGVRLRSTPYAVTRFSELLPRAADKKSAKAVSEELYLLPFVASLYAKQRELIQG